MKRLGLSSLAALLIATSTATAAAPKPAYVKALERRVAALEQANRSLRTSAQTAQAQANQALADIDVVAKSVVDLASFSVCTTAVQSDFNTGIYNIVAMMLGAPEADFRLDDKGACAAIGVTRGLLQTANAGNADPRFSALARLHATGTTMRTTVVTRG